MPEKTVRQMSEFERKRYSLKTKVFYSVMKGCVILWAVLLVIGLGLYGVTLTRQYVNHAINTAQYAATWANQETKPTALAHAVMGAYEALSDEERALMGTQDYLHIVAPLQRRHDYNIMVYILGTFAKSHEFSDVFYAMYDEERNALVYFADPDTVNRLYPGQWETVERREVKRFLDWDGEGKLYYISHTAKYGWLCTAGVPVHDNEGTVCGFIMTDVKIQNVANGMRSYALQMTVAMIIIAALLCVFMNRNMQKKLVNPINDIAEAAQNYVKDHREGSKETDHFAILNIRTGDEVENLSLVMADMERDIAAQEENLTRITAERERISIELSLATRIQEDMLPNTFPAFPGRKEFDIYASMNPAKEVGGDFYDFFLVDSDHLCMVMADVSGKGVPAALFMMASKIILANNAKLGKSPGQILTDTNAAICSNNREEMFVTVWLGILEISTGKLTAANAGHEYPVLKAPDGKFELIKDKHGFVIGGMDGVKYKEYELQLEKGSKLFLYTDGVPEATDANKELFGTGRMLETLNEQPDVAPEQVLANVSAGVDAFVKEAEQFDDLTMLCLEYKGPDAGEETFESANVLNIEATDANLERVNEFIDGFLEAMDCPLKTQMQIDVVVEEIFVNIAHYAYAPNTGYAKISVETAEDPASIAITFADKGMSYNPLEKEDPDVNASAEEREIGGLGIYMTKKFMDEVIYEYKDGQNVLTIKKAL